MHLDLPTMINTKTFAYEPLSPKFHSFVEASDGETKRTLDADPFATNHHLHDLGGRLQDRIRNDVDENLRKREATIQDVARNGERCWQAVQQPLNHAVTGTVFNAINRVTGAPKVTKGERACEALFQMPRILADAKRSREDLRPSFVHALGGEVTTRYFAAAQETDAALRDYTLLAPIAQNHPKEFVRAAHALAAPRRTEFEALGAPNEPKPRAAPADSPPQAPTSSKTEKKK